MAGIHLVINKAHAVLNSANQAYNDAIATNDFFEQLLSAVPVADDDFYKQVQGWQEQAVQAINVTYRAKRAAEDALEAAQQRYYN